MQYLYFKTDGTLHVKTKKPDPNLESEFPNPIAMHDGYNTMIASGDEVEEGMPSAMREKTRSEIESERTYSEARAAAYPSIEDQLDKIFHSGIDAWKADIQAIKDANPKEGA